MTLGDDVLFDIEIPIPVTIVDELTFDGTGPRPVSPQGETSYVLLMHMQRSTSRPTELLRQADGDETTGEARVWVRDAVLAAAGLTGLPIAPPEDTDGPPGARIDRWGIRWEITEEQGWDEFFGAEAAGFQRYLAAQRGATPP